MVLGRTAKVDRNLRGNETRDVSKTEKQTRPFPPAPHGTMLTCGACSLLALLAGALLQPASANVGDVLMPNYVPVKGCECLPWNAVSADPKFQASAARPSAPWAPAVAPAVHLAPDASRQRPSHTRLPRP